MARRARSRFVALVDRVKVDSRTEAILLIHSGRVKVNGVITRNPRTLVSPDAAVTLTGPRTLRGTVKLRAALARFAVDPSGATCLDVGAAAGGFTTALLEAGAARVYAVDTGYGQLRGSLRQDARVVNLERTNLRDLGARVVPEPVDLVCMDLSYVPLSEALPQLAGVEWAPAARLVALVKPTFELRAAALVVDPESIAKAEVLAASAAELCGWSVLDSVPAPTTGDAGAREVFLHGRRAEG